MTCANDAAIQIPLADLQRRAEPPMPAQNTHSGAAPQALLARS
jgi:hypothetical protein